MTHDADFYSGDKVDQALGELALDAVRVLSNQMYMAKQSKDKIAAANSILDRLGYGRATRAQAEVADREIRNALEAAASSIPKPSQTELAATSTDASSHE